MPAPPIKMSRKPSTATSPASPSPPSPRTGPSRKCGNTRKIIYYVYFKKDTGPQERLGGHSGQFSETPAATTGYATRSRWSRTTTTSKINWGDINDTFDGLDDWQDFRQRNRDHGKFYFGKFHHSVHQDWHTTGFKDTCPPNSSDDFRNGDYQFWARNNLRHVSVLNPGWNWGKASSPANIDLCTY